MMQLFKGLISCSCAHQITIPRPKSKRKVGSHMLKIIKISHRSFGISETRLELFEPMDHGYVWMKKNEAYDEKNTYMPKVKH